MSVPVYSSSKKNWFHIHPLLERLSGTPLASCPVSPGDPFRPPVVLRRDLDPSAGEPRWAMAHSTISAQTPLLSMATPPHRALLRRPQWSGWRTGFMLCSSKAGGGVPVSLEAAVSTWGTKQESQDPGGLQVQKQTTPQTPEEHL